MIKAVIVCAALLALAAGCGQKAAPAPTGTSPPRVQGKSAPPEVQSEFRNAPGASGAAPATH